MKIGKRNNNNLFSDICYNIYNDWLCYIIIVYFAEWIDKKYVLDLS